LYQTAVNNSQTTINNVQIQISNSIDKKQTQQLQQIIRVKRSEHKKLKKQLRLAEKQIATLEKDTIKLNTTTESTVQIARYQTENLDYKLKVTQEEKSILASSLQTSLLENSNNKTSFENAIVASRERETSLQAQAEGLRNQVKELKTRIESLTKTHSEQLKTITLEHQNTKTEVSNTRTQLNEARNTISNLQTTLADSNQETTTINAHYKQQLLDIEALKTSKENLEQEISREKTEHLHLQNKHKKLETLYDTAVTVASSSNKDEFAESNKKLLNDIERITSENIKYETKTQTLKQHITNIEKYIPAYDNLQNQFRRLEETNNNLQQQILKLDADLQISKLAHQEALQLLHERDDQDFSFASASDQEDQQPQQERRQPHPSPTPNISAFFVEQDPAQQAQQAPEMAAEAVENLITALNRRENVQAIPNFSGNGTDQYISSWLTEAEAIATIHNWDDATKKTNFASRLKGPALIWHSERARSHANETYNQWKQALKTHFKHPADRDKQLHKLENLTQKPNQPVRMFIDKINRCYNALYDDRNNQDLKLKNDLLVKILLKGVIKPIKTLMVLNQLLPEVTTWQDAQDAAIRCETTLYKTQSSNGMLELPSFTTTNIDSLTATAMQQQQKEIEMLRAQLNKVNFLGNANQPDDTVNYVGQQERGRPQQRYNSYNDHPNSVKWSDNTHSSQHYQRSRSQSRDNNHHPNSRDNYQKSSHQNQYQNNPQYKNSYQHQNTQQYQQPNKGYQNYTDQKYKSPSRRPGTPGPSSRSNSRNRDLSQVQCYRCDKFGHIAKECKTRNVPRLRQQEK
jgi:hypothetical protein